MKFHVLLDAVFLVTIGTAEIVTGYLIFLLQHLWNHWYSYNQATPYAEDIPFVALQGCALDIVYSRRGTGTLYNITLPWGISYRTKFSKRSTGSEEGWFCTHRRICKTCLILAIYILRLLTGGKNADNREDYQPSNYRTAVKGLHFGKEFIAPSSRSK